MLTQDLVVDGHLIALEQFVLQGAMVATWVSLTALQDPNHNPAV
jgi:hypothetical protein